ncbi:MAG: hypothetical protein AAFP04_04835 [Myxococcota bacterium]
MFRTTIAAVIALSAVAFASSAHAGDSATQTGPKSVKNLAPVTIVKHRNALAALKEAHTTRVANAQKERILLWRVVRPVDGVPSAAVASR